MKSPVWNNVDYPVSQGFGIVPDDPGLQSAYGYAADYGWPAGTHIGIDIAAPAGTQMFAAEPGTVLQTGFADYFRPAPVWILEDDGDVAIYGHLWEDNVVKGSHVSAGQKVGVSGDGETVAGTWTAEGAPNGPHIHYELRRPTVGGTPDGLGYTGYTAVDPTQELTGSAATPDTSGDNGTSSGAGAGNVFDPNGPWFERILIGAVGVVVLVIGAYALLPSSVKTDIVSAAKIAAV